MSFKPGQKARGRYTGSIYEVLDVVPKEGEVTQVHIRDEEKNEDRWVVEYSLEPLSEHDIETISIPVDQNQFCAGCGWVYDHCKCPPVPPMPEPPTEPENSLESVARELGMEDVIKSPAHYQSSLGIQVIDIINEWYPDSYNLGNVLKYLLRADKKGNRQQDLEKALQYLTWEVERGKSA